MTSEEYARHFGKILLEVSREVGVGTGEPAYRRCFTLGITRIMFQGADSYEVESNVQAVEVKPLGELVADIEEEAVDLIAYATALRLRVPEHDLEARRLVACALEQMQIVSKIIEPS
jgi:hypothetical protein